MKLLVDREALKFSTVISTADNDDPILNIGMTHSPKKGSKVNQHFTPCLIHYLRNLAR